MCSAPSCGRSTRGERAALVTIVSTSGSTPQRVGAKMLVFEDGRTVGHDWRRLLRERRARQGARGDPPAAAAARPLHAERRPGRRVRPDLRRRRWRSTSSRSSPHPDLYLVGAGHVSVEVARVASADRLPVHVVDDREKFANADRFPGAEVVVDDIPAWLGRTTLAPDAFVVVVTRGHRYDLEAMRAAGPPADSLPGPDRQPRQGRSGSSTPSRGEGVPAERLSRGPRPDRPRHRRGQPGRDRGQHRGRADRRAVRADRRAPRFGRRPAGVASGVNPCHSCA